MRSNIWKFCFRGSLALSSLALAPAHAADTCKLSKFDLPVTMSGMRALIGAKINGENAQFVVDSGAFFSTMSSATAAQFKLKQRSAPFDLQVKGIGGEFQASVTTVKEFTLGGVPLHNVEFIVGGSEVGSDSVGLLGQNFLQQWDVEYDLANGVVRLFKVEGCKHKILAYWLKPGQDFSTVEIESTTPMDPHTTGSVYLNGKKLRALFDTGADASLLSQRAAERAGVPLDSAGVVESGYSTGIGRGSIKTYVALFSSFKLGDDEEIRNVKLQVANVGLQWSDILIGADFFLSHRIFVANSQHKMYVTYNGGPVFSLGKSPPIQASDPAEGKSSETQAADNTQDAPAFARRGAAFASRHDFAHALVNLTRACELDPNEPDYLYQRGMVYWKDNQAPLAVADFDHALSLKPDLLSVLMARAELRMGNDDVSGAIADLEAADRSAPKQADLRFSLAQAYESAGRWAPAVAQYDLWVANHPDDSKMVSALNARCWARALLGTALDKALDDCNRALGRADSKSPAYASILDSRGLVRLRLGDYGKSISDYDAALKISPKNASSLYCRGIAKRRTNKTQEGDVDIAAAVAIAPKIADHFNGHGIAP